jgi:hypothetical protein
MTQRQLKAPELMIKNTSELERLGAGGNGLFDGV